MLYCVELWGSTCKTAINSIIMLQKRAICLKAGYYDHINSLFIKLHLLKFSDLVDFKIMQIMYRANTMSLPDPVQRFFSVQECKYGLRNVCKFTVPKAKKKD